MRTALPRAGTVSGTSAAVGPRSPPGPGRLRRDHRCPVASAAAPPTVPRRRLRLRGCPPGTLRAARPALAPRGSARTRQLAAQPSGSDAARTGRIVPDPALRVVAAGGGSVLSLACQHLESERATRHRRIHPAVRRYPGAHRRTHPVRPAALSAEAGDAVRTAAPP